MKALLSSLDTHLETERGGGVTQAGKLQTMVPLPTCIPVIYTGNARESVFQ